MKIFPWVCFWIAYTCRVQYQRHAMGLNRWAIKRRKKPKLERQYLDQANRWNWYLERQRGQLSDCQRSSDSGVLNSRPLTGLQTLINLPRAADIPNCPLSPLASTRCFKKEKKTGTKKEKKNNNAVFSFDRRQRAGGRCRKLNHSDPLHFSLFTFSLSQSRRGVGRVCRGRV